MFNIILSMFKKNMEKNINNPSVRIYANKTEK